VKVKLTIELLALFGFFVCSRVARGCSDVGGSRIVRGSGVVDGNRSASVVLARRGSRCLRFRGGHVKVESRHLCGIGWVDEGVWWTRREREETK
jgi:hypothetical protein